MKRLFIIDDDKDILESMQIWFQKKGFEVEAFSLPEPMLNALEISSPVLILMDVNIHDKDGRKICRELKQSHKTMCPIILFSANPFVLKDYEQYLADGAIAKPFSLKEITSIVTSYIQAG